MPLAGTQYHASALVLQNAVRLLEPSMRGHNRDCMIPFSLAAREHPLLSCRNFRPISTPLLHFHGQSRRYQTDLHFESDILFWDQAALSKRLLFLPFRLWL